MLNELSMFGVCGLSKPPRRWVPPCSSTHSQARTRVILADDHAVVSDGLRMLLSAEAGVTVISKGIGGREAVLQAQHPQTDVMVLESACPNLTGSTPPCTRE